jgi:hypothetical protein
MRRSFWAWLLPVFLLLGQYAEYRHELTHYAKKAANPDKQSPTKADACALCLAYGDLSGTAKPELVSARLRTDLRFAQRADRSDASPARPLPAARNRGPPHA